MGETILAILGIIAFFIGLILIYAWSAPPWHSEMLDKSFAKMEKRRQEKIESGESVHPYYRREKRTNN